ncbi:hypothetical protein P1J78_01135 [Psychromarinibacter sp. C21-152]|uniref:Uncharacterized protein n=1 Tax=Psychromarinibacter sediminicola TaxID=3033385 RepID=A0AAE3NPK6_9RHOB|nr:hypothetical protein [Psychromarinibacter sediminicola]MDF0599324.1 hypothetical protein [Psychromarinibacter sediminicola]
MGLWRDIVAAWARFADARQRSPRYTLFTHALPAFPLPERAPLPDPPPVVALATPCRDAAGDLVTYAGLVRGLDYPRDRLHWLMLEGDSTDDTRAQAAALLDGAEGYASTRLLTLDLGGARSRAGRTRAELQRDRRAGLARCRNRLLAAAMETGAAYVLFLDVDMAEVPPDSLRRALEWRAPVLVANCLRHEGDTVFDRNSFRYTAPVSDRSARRFLEGGLYQPPTGFFRHYPDHRSGPEIAPLSCVGGTFLLIRRDVIAAGVDFPEEPYQLHIETEGLALKAADHGFGSFMAPRLVVRHGPH